MNLFRRAALTAMVLFAAGDASAATTCTLVIDAATNATLIRVGDRCDERLTPASTFKIPLSLIGFDSGILVDADRPAWPYKQEYQTWNDAWKQTTTPQTWLRDSVVWYSQVLTRKLGAARFQEYIDKLAYANRDLSGEPGRNDGLTTAWLSSSLRISATEQVEFVQTHDPETVAGVSRGDRSHHGAHAGCRHRRLACERQDRDRLRAARRWHERSRSSGRMVRGVGHA